MAHKQIDLGGEEPTMSVEKAKQIHEQYLLPAAKGMQAYVTEVDAAIKASGALEKLAVKVGADPDTTHPRRVHAGSSAISTVLQSIQFGLDLFEDENMVAKDMGVISMSMALGLEQYLKNLVDREQPGHDESVTTALKDMAEALALVIRQRDPGYGGFPGGLPVDSLRMVQMDAEELAAALAGGEEGLAKALMEKSAAGEVAGEPIPPKKALN